MRRVVLVVEVPYLRSWERTVLKIACPEQGPAMPGVTTLMYRSLCHLGEENVVVIGPLTVIMGVISIRV
jgi:hypothetical protein